MVRIEFSQIVRVKVYCYFVFPCCLCSSIYLHGRSCFVQTTVTLVYRHCCLAVDAGFTLELLLPASTERAVLSIRIQLLLYSRVSCYSVRNCPICSALPLYIRWPVLALTVASFFNGFWDLRGPAASITCVMFACCAFLFCIRIPWSLWNKFFGSLNTYQSTHPIPKTCAAVSPFSSGNHITWKGILMGRYTYWNRWNALARWDHIICLSRLNQ